MKIGIYGGTFDPIHYGHLKIARTAYELFNLNVLYFIPSGNSYMKKDVSSAADRLEMVELAIKKETGFVTDSIEINHAGPSYSYETVQTYRERYPDDELYFLIGEDSLRNLHLWKNIHIICRNAIILVAGREQTSDLDSLYNQTTDVKQIMKDLQKDYQARIEYFQMKLPFSSSGIREAVRQKNLVIPQLPESVLHYIIQHKLYCNMQEQS